MIANLMMYNNSHFSVSTMESEPPVPINKMTYDQVKLALGQQRSKLRVLDQEDKSEGIMLHAISKKKIAEILAQRDRKIAEILAQRDREIAGINAQAQLECTLIKRQVQERVSQVNERVRNKARFVILTRDNLKKREEEFEKRQSDKQVANSIQPEVTKKSISASDYTELLEAKKHLEKRGIYVGEPSGKAQKDRKYDPSRYSMKSNQSHKQNGRSETPKRRQ